MAIKIIAIAPTGIGISGSDRIFIELARQWSKKVPIEILTTNEGVSMMEGQKLEGKHLKITKLEEKLPINFFLKYLYKIYLGIKLGFSFDINQKPVVTDHYLYSSSDFWMDVVPAVIFKLRYRKKIKWIATWYQTAPNPLRGYAEHSAKNIEQRKIRKKSYNLSAFLYWFSQLPVKPLVKKYADKVIVNNEDERKQFPKMESEGKVIVLLGAVRLDVIENWKLKIGRLPKVYDAVFQGRFHPQKGVVELIDIWKKVVNSEPDAKLAMIGDGPLYKNVEERIMKYGLERNVKLFGYVFDGDKKYKIFSQSKIVVHPAFYDSGGMASAEAMAFGIPAIGFNLKAYETYYPKGMVKVPLGNIRRFAKGTVKLLEDYDLRKTLGEEAVKMIRMNWSWEKRSNYLFNKVRRS